MKLYIIRHGESVSNISGCWSGWTDVPLTEKGIQDAVAVRPYLEGLSFQKVFSSDLQRAYDTAVWALPGCEPEKLTMLREIHVGTLAGMPFSAKRTPGTYLDYEIYGGESYGTFSSRVRSFLSMLEQLDVQTVAAFSHGGFLRMLLNEVCEQKFPRSTVQCNNCTLAIFEYSNNRWSLHSWINTQ